MNTIMSLKVISLICCKLKIFITKSMKQRFKIINNLLLITAFVSLLYACSISNEIQTYDYRNRNIDNVSDTLVDSSFIKILEPYQKKLEDKMMIKIAETKQSMVSYRPESPLGNLLSDMVFEAGVEYLNENSRDINLDWALLNLGGIRSSLPEGPIYVQNAFEIMPFENVMVFLELTGGQIIELCNYIASRGGEGVAGITFGMKNNVAYDIKIQGIGVDRSKNYWLVANDYIAGGGDGMKILTWAKDKIVTDIKIRDIFIDKLKEAGVGNNTLDAEIEGRLYYVN